MLEPDRGQDLDLIRALDQLLPNLRRNEPFGEHASARMHDDLLLCRRLWLECERRLKEKELFHVFQIQESPLAIVLSRKKEHPFLLSIFFFFHLFLPVSLSKGMELSGIMFDRSQIFRHRDTLLKRIESIEKEAESLLGHHVPLSSTSSVQQVIYHELALKPSVPGSNTNANKEPKKQQQSE
jgi:DNA polymerase I-like protein with 3'-5' exonuclease and polymerase domains